MSSIPPAGHASLIQTHGAQNRAEETRRKQSTDEARRSSKDAFADRLQEVIENSDKDSEVYADAEGAGSQGKTFSEDRAPEDEHKADDQPAPDGPAGSALDIEA